LEKVSVIVQHKGQVSTIPIRKGLGLQVLEYQCPALEFDCRKADCGICIIRVLKGNETLSPPTAREADFLRAMHADPDERLACQCRVFADVEFRIEY